MTLYSSNLGRCNFTDTGVNHLLYSVPASGGPAIIRSCAIAAAPDAEILVYVNDTSKNYTFAAFTATAGPPLQVVTFDLYLPIEPNWSINATNNGTSGNYNVMVGGYQFSSP